MRTILSVLVLAGLAWRADGGDGLLKGIKEVSVQVAEFYPDIEKDGLHADDVRTDVELRFREAGLRVVPLNELAKILSAPTFYVMVNSVQDTEPRFYAYTAEAGLMESMVPLRIPVDEKPWRVRSWGITGVGMARAHLVASIIRTEIRRYAEKFLNDWLADNGK